MTYEQDVVIDYDPSLIEENSAFKIYFDTRLNGISDEEIQYKMREDCVCPYLLLTPAVISLNDWGKELKHLLSLLKAYVKQAFENHLTLCPLTGPASAFGVNNNVQYQGCEKFNKVLKFMEFIKHNMDEQHHQLFDDCYKKLHLYLGHRVRVVTKFRQLISYCSRWEMTDITVSWTSK